MHCAVKSKNWFERRLEEPFLQAEIYRAEATKSNDPNYQGKGVLTILMVSAVTFAGFCLHWLTKYITD